MNQHMINLWLIVQFSFIPFLTFIVFVNFYKLGTCNILFFFISLLHHLFFSSVSFSFMLAFEDPDFLVGERKKGGGVVENITAIYIYTRLYLNCEHALFVYILKHRRKFFCGFKKKILGFLRIKFFFTKLKTFKTHFLKNIYHS